LTRLDIDNPLIVTDAALVKSGTVELALAHWASAYEIFDRVLPDPEIAIVEDCMRVYREGGHDGLIGLAAAPSTSPKASRRMPVTTARWRICSASIRCRAKARR
jgi:hypothetical protein